MYGLNFISNSGNLTIDDNYSNFLQESEGVVSNGGVIGMPSGPHLLMVRPDIDGAWVELRVTAPINTVPTDYTVFVSSGTLSFKIFRPFIDINGVIPSFGLLVYDANSNLVYNSNYPQMHIENWYTYNLSDASLFVTFNPPDAIHHTVTKNFDSSQTRRRFVSLPVANTIVYSRQYNSSTATFHPLRFRFIDNNTLQYTPSNGQNSGVASFPLFNLFFSGQTVHVGF